MCILCNSESLCTNIVVARLQQSSGFRLKQGNCASIKTTHATKMWKSKTRVTSSNPRVTSSNPRVASSNPQVTSSNSRVTSSNLLVTSSNSQVARLKARV